MAVLLPHGLASVLPRHFRNPCDIKSLGCLGLGQVYAARFEGTEAIIKISPQFKERRFYEQLAGDLVRQGVIVPELLWSGSLPTGQGPDLAVIMVEKLPRLLPQTRWRVDPGTLAVLARLHTSGVYHEQLSAEVWPEAMNHSAALPFAKPELAFTLLEQARRLSGPVLAGHHIVSGDPNGGNWGLRTNGQLVLFDWERVGLGSAALDLAGVAYGEPNDDEFAAIASLYLSFRPSLRQLLPALVTEIKIARIYFAALLLSRHQIGERLLPAAILSYYRQRFLPWVVAALG